MLETTWFVLWGVLWAVYFILDGFDLGIGSLLPFLTKNEADRRAALNAMGPFWDGNEVWLVTAGGVTFAAFPGAYAIMFSALYSALMLVLFALILRGVSLEFRSLRESPAWRRFWDCGIFVGSVLPAILLGVAFGNIFKGIPIDQNGVYQGTLFTLLNPYGLAGGVLFLLLFLIHGALWLGTKAEGDLKDRALGFAVKAWPVLLVVAVVFLVYTAFATDLWRNYMNNFLLLIIPALDVVCLLLLRQALAKAQAMKAWLYSAGAIGLCALFGVIGLYPALLPSSLNKDWSVTIANAASSPLTLKIMLVVALIFVPLVILYQLWVHKVFFKPLEEEDHGLGGY